MCSVVVPIWIGQRASSRRCSSTERFACFTSSLVRRGALRDPLLRLRRRRACVDRLLRVDLAAVDDVDLTDHRRVDHAVVAELARLRERHRERRGPGRVRRQQPAVHERRAVVRTGRRGRREERRVASRRRELWPGARNVTECGSIVPFQVQVTGVSTFTVTLAGRYSSTAMVGSFGALTPGPDRDATAARRLGRRRATAGQRSRHRRSARRPRHPSRAHHPHCFVLMQRSSPISSRLRGRRIEPSFAATRRCRITRERCDRR